MKDIFVVKVINENTVVLNVGKQDGILSNQRFMIYGIDEEELFDPITKESLGYAEFSKGTGKVNMLTERTCTVISDQTQKSTRKEKVQNCDPFNLAVSLLHPSTPKVIEYDEIVPKPFDSPSVGDKAKMIN